MEPAEKSARRWRLLEQWLPWCLTLLVTASLLQQLLTRSRDLDDCYRDRRREAIQDMTMMGQLEDQVRREQEQVRSLKRNCCPCSTQPKGPLQEK